MSDIDTPETTEPAAQPHDMADVIRHMRHARRINAEIAATERDYRTEIARIQDLLDERLRILRNELDWYAKPIRSFHEMLMTEDDANKTLSTPYGRSKITVPSKPQTFIDDADAVTVWATKHAPDIVQRKVLVTDLRKHTDVNELGDVVMVDRATGEIVAVPGVHSEVPDPRWSLDLDPGSAL